MAGARGVADPVVHPGQDEAAIGSQSWFGTAWIDRVTTEFTVVKNGMRFPGRVEIDLTRYVIPCEGRMQAFRTEHIYNVEQVYSAYQFFNVRTAEEIRAFGRPSD